MKLSGFSALIPALAALFSRNGTALRRSSLIRESKPVRLSNRMGLNQRQVRKNRRRAFAAGNLKAFN